MRPKNNESGIALILVLWVMVLLIALGTEFACPWKQKSTPPVISKRTQKPITSRKRVSIWQGLKFSLMFNSIHVLKTKGIFSVQLSQKINQKTPPRYLRPQQVQKTALFQNQKQVNWRMRNWKQNWRYPSSLRRTELPLGRGFVHYIIHDENGKININTASRDVLSKALAANGLTFDSERDTIVDSILDWIDKDDRHRVNGAESDYYEKLSPPYSAKNSPLDSLEELLKIRGITPELFYGSEEYEPDKSSDKENAPGLFRIFTVQGVSQFNPNTAERAVLEIMYPENQVDEILKKKEERGWYNQSKSTHFKIEATGTFEHSLTQHTIVAIIEKQQTGDEATLLTRYWNDNFIRR